MGEVLTRNPGGHREYYRDAGRHRPAVGGRVAHTGDLGRLDADGYLYIVGRKKEMIVRGGMNVYADDVEAALQAHPDVVEAAVAGVPHDVLGEDVAAWVVLRPGSGATAEAGRRLRPLDPGRLQGAPSGGGRGRAAPERRRARWSSPGWSTDPARSTGAPAGDGGAVR